MRSLHEQAWEHLGNLQNHLDNLGPNIDDAHYNLADNFYEKARTYLRKSESAHNKGDYTTATSHFLVAGQHMNNGADIHIMKAYEPGHDVGLSLAQQYKKAFKELHS